MDIPFYIQERPVFPSDLGSYYPMQTEHLFRLEPERDSFHKQFFQ